MMLISRNLISVCFNLFSV